MKNILSIQKRKEDDQIKEEERQKRKAVLMAETGMTFEETQEEIQNSCLLLGNEP
jgi:hypothetical protein